MLPLFYFFQRNAFFFLKEGEGRGEGLSRLVMIMKRFSISFLVAQIQLEFESTGSICARTRRFDSVWFVDYEALEI